MILYVQQMPGAKTPHRKLEMCCVHDTRRWVVMFYKWAQTEEDCKVLLCSSVCLVSECVGVKEWDLRKRIRRRPSVINTAAVTWAFALWFIPFRATGFAVWQRQLYDFPLDLAQANLPTLRGHLCIYIVSDSRCNHPMFCSKSPETWKSHCRALLQKSALELLDFFYLLMSAWNTPQLIFQQDFKVKQSLSTSWSSHAVIINFVSPPLARAWARSQSWGHPKRRGRCRKDEWLLFRCLWQQHPSSEYIFLHPLGT